MFAEVRERHHNLHDSVVAHPERRRCVHGDPLAVGIQQRAVEPGDASTGNGGGMELRTPPPLVGWEEQHRVGEAPDLIDGTAHHFTEAAIRAEDHPGLGKEQTNSQRIDELSDGLSGTPAEIHAVEPGSAARRVIADASASARDERWRAVAFGEVERS